MNYNSLYFPKFLIFTFLSLLIFTTATQAQRIEPDEQIKREMLAYVGKVEAAAFQSSPTRVLNQRKSNERTESNRAFRENESGAPANYALERRAFDIINQQRTAKGLKPLRWNEDMARVARLHSENMARYKFFSHQGRDGSKVNNRANSLAKRTWYAIGENIAFNKGFSKPVEMACQHWMTSPGHRENILDRGWTESGIGAAIAPDGSFYLTQVFIN